MSTFVMTVVSFLKMKIENSSLFPTSLPSQQALLIAGALLVSPCSTLMRAMTTSLLCHRSNECRSTCEPCIPFDPSPSR